MSVQGGAAYPQKLWITVWKDGRRRPENSVPAGFKDACENDRQPAAANKIMALKKSSKRGQARMRRRFHLTGKFYTLCITRFHKTDMNQPFND
jgi:hypothetical protein